MSRPDISIISAGAPLADARLHRIANSLIGSGLTVEILAPGKAEDAPEGAIIRKIHSGKGFHWRLHRAFYSPWMAKGEVLYCLAPEAQLFTWIACKVRSKIYCADIFEDYLTLLRDRAWARRFFGIPGRIASAISRLATIISSKATVTTVADQQVPPFHAKQRIVLRNLPDKRHLTQSGAISTNPRAIYIGDVRESRGLHTMLGAAVIATNWSFDIVGPISDADAAWIHLWAIANEDASARVHFHGRQTPRNSWKLAEGAWVGLSLLKPTPAFIAAIPSKLYEYMSVGLATISTSLPRCKELIEQSGSGAIADNPEEVATILQLWEKDLPAIKKIRGQALAWSSMNLDSETEYAIMVTAIQKAMH